MLRHGWNGRKRFLTPTYIRKAAAGRLAAAAILLACGSVSLLQAQTPTLTAKLALRPLTTPEITTYKLPTTTQKSGGLTSVALGEPAYLEIQGNIAYPATDITGVTWALTYKPAGSKATLLDSPLGKTIPIYDPSDRLAFQPIARMLLKPDVEGQYVVTATITAKSGTVNVGQTIFGATYVGIAGCTKCHSGGLAQNMATSWAKTSHSTLFKDGINGVASDHYSGSCISCHTVGYDANNTVPNGGFSDLAAQLKWTMPTVTKAGNWEAVPEALKNVSNIQCENCHGPGSMHAYSGGAAMAISKTFAPADCAQCHEAPTHHIKSTEFNNSRHAIATRDPSGAGRESCVVCHTGPGFVGMAKGDTTVDTTYSPIGCQTCHESHGQTSPATNAHLVRKLDSVTLADGTKVTDGGAGLLCMNCHKSRQNAAVYAAKTAGSSRFGPHHGPQADMLQGTNGFTYGQTIPSSAHYFAAGDSCVTCHMQALAETAPGFSKTGGHTFTLSLPSDGKSPAVQLVTECQNCHGPRLTTFDFPLMDYDGDGKIDGVQTEVQHLLDKLSAMLPPAGKSKAALAIDSTWTQPQLEAAYNWLMVTEDRSKGIHNTAYTVGLLKASIANLSNPK